MAIYRPNQKSGTTHHTNRCWFRISKSSEYRQIDLFAALGGCNAPKQR